MNNKFRQVIFKLNLDKKRNMKQIMTCNFGEIMQKRGIFESYPQFTFFVYTIVDKTYIF